MQGKQLEESIPPVFNYMVNQYHTYAGVRLAMHYYSFYETFYDEEQRWGSDVKDLITKLNTIIGENMINSGSGMEATIKAIDDIRNDIMKRMQVLTTYADIFQIYEYILNRLEYQFKEAKLTVDDDEFAREVLRYIFDTQDSVIINDKIKEIIGQLPVRMTKQKYFDLISDSLGTYLGAEQDSLKSYLYMLRTSAMLYEVEQMEVYYPKLWEYKTYLSKINYKEITKTEYDKAKDILLAVSGFLEAETTAYYSLQEVVNEVYAMILCKPYIGMYEHQFESQDNAVSIIIKDINSLFLSKEKMLPDSSILENFTLLEGIQEDLFLELTGMEDVLYEIDTNQRELSESMLVDKLLNVILRVKDLVSNSLFIDFTSEQEDGMVDDKNLIEEKDSLIKDLSDLFNKHDRAIGRAVMANTINKLPVFFKDHKEVMEYVRYSLDRCSNEYEKMACYEIINEIMSE